MPGVEQLPDIRTEVPGPRSRALAARLARVECPEVTALGEPPVFWERASGANVWDPDGNRYVDLLAGFGVAALGHAPREVVEVQAEQAATLPHALGDLQPARVKVELLETLERVLPADLGCAILSSSGSDAVESALKTALRVTGRPGVVAFVGAYHGLGLGALDTTWRAHFRAPFEQRLPGRTRFVPYGDAGAVRDALRAGDVGAILVEPIQGRGGIVVPEPGFLAALRELADGVDTLLVADEIYTGLGRTGSMLACEAEGVIPDVVALGKALGNGFPISACAGREAVMRAWGESDGEAVHTSTHLGNPVGCAVARRVLEILERDALPKRAAELGARLLARLRRELGASPHVREVRGRGLMIGVELDSPERAERATREMLRRGYILLGEGDDGRVLSLTPPLSIAEELLDGAVDALLQSLGT